MLLQQKLIISTADISILLVEGIERLQQATAKIKRGGTTA